MTPNKSRQTIPPRSPEKDAPNKLNNNIILVIIAGISIFLIIVYLSANAVSSPEHHLRHARELKKTLGAPPKIKQLLDEFSPIVNKPHTDTFGNIYTIRTFYLRDFQEYTCFYKPRSLFHRGCFMGIIRINIQLKTHQI